MSQFIDSPKEDILEEEESFSDEVVDKKTGKRIRKGQADSICIHEIVPKNVLELKNDYSKKLKYQWLLEQTREAELEAARKAKEEEKSEMEKEEEPQSGRKVSLSERDPRVANKRRKNNKSKFAFFAIHKHKEHSNDT